MITKTSGLCVQSKNNYYNDVRPEHVSARNCHLGLSIIAVTE